jgi:hypothetical protein
MAQKFLNGIVSTGNILPSSDSTYDLGHGNYRWANLNVDAISTTSTFVAGGTIALNSSISTLNKAQTSYISFATRNTSGSETLMDLSNIGTATFEGLVTVGPGTTGSPYDATTFLHVKGTTRSIVQQSSTADAYYMFGDAAANNVAWLGYNHSTNQLSLHTSGTTYIDGNTTFAGTITTGDNSNDNYISATFSDSTYTRMHGYGLYMSRNNSYIRPTTDTGKTLYIGSSDKRWDNVNVHATNATFAGNVDYKPYPMPSTGSTAGWYKVGTLSSFSQNGNVAVIEMEGHAGYNAANNQDFCIKIYFKTSNGNGGGPNNQNFNSWYERTGLNSSNIEIVWKTSATNVYDLYMYLPVHTLGGYYKVRKRVGTWTHSAASASDPGANSSAILEAVHVFNVDGDATFAGDIILGANHIGRDSHNIIDFATDNHITFKTDQSTALQIDSNQSVKIIAGSLQISGDNANFATLTESGSGDFTIAAVDDIRLDSGGGDVVLKAGGTEYGRLSNSSADFVIQNTTSDKDIIFKGVDDATTITALTLDMSDGGWATFNSGIHVANTFSPSTFGKATFAGDVTVSKDSPLLTLKNTTNEHTDGGAESKIVFKDHADNSLGKIEVSHNGTNDNALGNMYFQTSNGSTVVTALELNSSQNATFTGTISSGSNIFPTTNGGGSLGLGTNQWSALHLTSSSAITWANGDASILEGEVGGYSLSFNVYNGSTAMERVLLLEKTKAATFAGNVTIAHATNPYIYINDTNAGAGIFQQEGNDTRIGSDTNTTVKIVQNNQDAITINTSKNATFAGTGTFEGGILHLGKADTASGHINAKELMTFNIDTDNDDTNRYFAWYTNGESGSGTELLKIEEDGNATFSGTVRTNGYLRVVDPSAEIWIGDSLSGTDGGFIKWNSTHDYLYIGNSYSSAYNENIKIDNTGVVTLSDSAQYHKIQTFYSGSYTSGFKFSDYNGGIWYDAGSDDLTLNAGHANSQMLLNSGGAIALTLDASQNATFAGNIATASTKKVLFDGASGHTYIAEESDSNLKFYVGGTEQLNITNGGLHFNASLTIPNYINHAGDSGTKFGFEGNDAFRLYTDSTMQLQIDSAGDATFAGSVKVKNALIDNASVTSATTTTTVASVSGTTYAAVFFDYVIYKSSNIRAGTVVACSDGTTVSFTETSTTDLGDTSDVTLAVDLSSSNFRLRATTASSTWNIKALTRAI